jgi:hypothetical protein
MRSKSGITKQCPLCGAKFYAPQSQAQKRKYCSKQCADLAQTTSPTQTIVCKACGKEFVAKPDHGAWPVYCSRWCFENRKGEKKFKPKKKKCPVCGRIFLAGRSYGSPDGYRVYCSSRCFKKGRRAGATKKCINCGKPFYLSPAQAAKRPQASCCSPACQYEYYTKERNSNWKGGCYQAQGIDHIFCQIPNEIKNEYVSKYYAQHRIVAAKAIGRPLKKGTEPVIHLNKKSYDNRPENLFICRDNSEMVGRVRGRLPWPDESNLGTYK